MRDRPVLKTSGSPSSPAAEPPPTEEVKLYETPDGIASQTSDCTIYVNVVPSNRSPGGVCFRVVKLMHKERKRFVTTFHTDAEMARRLGFKILAVAEFMETEHDAVPSVASQSGGNRK